ncbi:MAG: SpoIID/LytB domain-containing protein, partial [Thermostichales cyanobacterium BF4_bins_65]
MRLSRRHALVQTTTALLGAWGAAALASPAVGIPVQLGSTQGEFAGFDCLAPFQLEQQFFSQGRWRLERQGSRLRVGGQLFPLPCRLQGGVIRIGSSQPRAYRGWIQIQAWGSWGLRLMNWVDLESYVLGVVTAEMPADWPLASLMAQAVLVRTRALAYRQPMYREPRRWLQDSTQDQRYGGLSSEDPRGWQAVQRTRGQILTYGGQPIAVLFHSTCAGHTSANQLIFAPPPRPYLQGVPCSYCQDSPFYAPYRVRLSYGQLEQIFGSPDITLIQADPWGRPLQIAMGSRLWSGQEWWQRLGSRLGWGVLPGNRFSWVVGEGGIVLTGQGAGHGVG